MEDVDDDDVDDDEGTRFHKGTRIKVYNLVGAM